MKNGKILIIVLIVIAVLISGCDGNNLSKKEYDIGETGTVDSIEITIKDVIVNKDDPDKLNSYDKYIIVYLTVTNAGNVPRSIKISPPDTDIYFYIQDIRGERYPVFSAFMRPKWQVYIEPGKTYNVELYFYPGTPIKNAWMVVESYDTGFEKVDSADFKFE